MSIVSSKSSKLQLLAVVAGIAALGAVYAINSVSASHGFELGVAGQSGADNTHIRLDGLTLPPAGAIPVYDASPNFVSENILIAASAFPLPASHVP